MSILVPKAHRDGSQLGMHKREWSNILSQNLYSSASFIDMAKITSGSKGLEVDDRPIITSPFTTTNITNELTDGIVGLRINNLMNATADYNMNSNTLTSLRNPAAPQEAATKYYVDQAIDGIKWKASVKGGSIDLASPSVVYWKAFEEATWVSDGQGGYNRSSYGNPGWEYSSDSNGDMLVLKRPKQTRTGGGSYGLNVNTSNLTWLDDDNGSEVTRNHSISQYLFDSINTFENNERILVKSHTDATKNGIYIFESTGSNPADASSQYAKPTLRRAKDFNETLEISSAAVFIEEGSSQADTAYVCTTNQTDIADLSVGSFAINWTPYGNQVVDNVTIYKDNTQSSRLEVTGVLRDINDLFYNYGTSARVNVDDGHFLVGNGTTFVAEKDNVARTSLGLGTGNSPTFANLTLTDGALTASHLISNSASPLILSSDLSGTVDLSVKNISADGSLTSNSIVSTTSVSAGTTIQSTQGITAGNGLTVSTGNLSVNNGSITAANSISAQFVTASVALSASFLQLKEFSDITNYTTTSGYPTQNALYVANNTLYFDGTAVGGGGGSGGQPRENVLYYGGNIVSDTNTAPNTDHSTTALYMRIGVSGSHLSTSTDAAGRASHYQILTGSFQEITGTRVDLDGGTIDNTTIGLTTPTTGNFTTGTFATLNATTASLDKATISSGQVTGSYGEFTVLSGSSVDLNGGTIDSIIVGSSTPAAGTFTTLVANTSLVASTADINAGTIDGTVIGATTPAAGTFSTLTVTSGTLFDSNKVNITGGFLDNVTIGANSTIAATIAEYNTGSFVTLNATNLVVPKSGGSGYVDINVSDTSRTSTITNSGAAVLNIKATKGDFSILSGSIAKLTNANILDGNITGSLGVFSVMTGSSVEIDSVNIKSGSLNNIFIGEDASSNNYGRFDILTGSDSYIGDITQPNSYKSYGRFLTLSASHAYITDPDSTNKGVFEHLTGSYLEIKNQINTLSGSIIDFSGNIVQNIGTPNSTSQQRNHAINRAYVDTVVGIKTSVRLASSTHVDLASGVQGGQDSVDSIQLALGNRILLTSQNTASENGIWQVTNGAPVRPFDFKTDDPAGGYIVLVEEGNSNRQSIYSLKSSGNIDTADISVTKISSQFGVSTDGKGLLKSTNVFDVDINEGDWDLASYEDRANLSFNGTTSPRTNQLILSGTIRLDELKVVNSSNSSGKVQISGSADSVIDNVKIGVNTPTEGKFSALNLTGNITLDNNTEITSSNGSSNTKIGLNEATFNKITIPNTLIADNTGSSGEDLIVISGSLKMSNSQPSDRSQRLWLSSGGDLYFQNEKIGSGGGTEVGNVTSTRDFTSIFVTGSQSAGHGAYISGSLVVEGDVQIKGSTTTISSSNTTFQDSIIGLGITGSDTSSETFNNLGDRGLIFARSANQYDALPGMWWDGTKFNFAKSLTSPSSGSFGTVTERSKVNTGILESTEVTASIGLKINDYNLPLSDGNANQVISTDGSGNLTFVNQTSQAGSLKKLDVVFSTTDPTPSVSASSVSKTVNAANQNPDIILIDVSNHSNDSYTQNSFSKYVTVLVNSLSTDFFAEGREFFVGLTGFDYENYQNVDNPPDAIKIGLAFDGSQLSNNNILRVNNTVNGLYVPEAIFQSGEIIHKLDSNDTDKVASTIRYFFTGGPDLDFHDTFLLDRVINDNDSFYAFKFEWVSTSQANKLKLKSNFDNLIIFNKNDSRFV